MMTPTSLHRAALAAALLLLLAGCGRPIDDPDAGRAEAEGYTGDLGQKCKAGILHRLESRRAFLADAAHRVRFVYTPKHCSWLNPIEIGFSILVRRALKRASFTSTDSLGATIRDFIAYFNRLLAKPFRWTYKGRPLAV